MASNYIQQNPTNARGEMNSCVFLVRGTREHIQTSTDHTGIKEGCGVYENRMKLNVCSSLSICSNFALPEIAQSSYFLNLMLFKFN